MRGRFGAACNPCVFSSGPHCPRLTPALSTPEGGEGAREGALLYAVICLSSGIGKNTTIGAKSQCHGRYVPRLIPVAWLDRAEAFLMRVIGAPEFLDQFTHQRRFIFRRVVRIDEWR